MNLSRRELLTGATLAGVVVSCGTVVSAADEAAGEKAEKKEPAPAPLPGQLSEDALGKLLEAIGLKPKKTESRYDFTFTSKQQGEDWTLSMSAVLSADGQTIWVMAWLDELPRSSRDVPRTALLKLLAENDKLGKGKFFAYIPTNRRFCLQQVIENREMSSKKFRSLLVDLGESVSQTYPVWATTAWKDAPPSDGGGESGDSGEAVLKSQDSSAPSNSNSASNGKASAPAKTTGPQATAPTKKTPR